MAVNLMYIKQTLLLTIQDARYMEITGSNAKMENKTIILESNSIKQTAITAKFTVSNQVLIITKRCFNQISASNHLVNHNHDKSGYKLK